jgi:hypothetical protein
MEHAATAGNAEQTDIYNACLKILPDGARRLTVPDKTGTTRATTIVVSTSMDNAFVVKLYPSSIACELFLDGTDGRIRRRHP